MTSYKQLIEVAENLLAQATKLDAKHTKAESARIRKSINTIQKLAVSAKRELIAQDAK